MTWSFTPPTYWDGGGVSTPDAGEDGLDPLVMLHAVLGTPETLAGYEDYLLRWPDSRHRMRINPDGTMEHLGRVAEDVYPLLDDLLRLRAASNCATASATSTRPETCWAPSQHSGRAGRSDPRRTRRGRGCDEARPR